MTGHARLRPHAVIRHVRLVPVGRPAPPGTVDLRIRDGTVVEASPGLPRRGAEAEYDAAGRWAIPGLWDAHVHFTQWAANQGRLDLSGTSGPDECVARVARHVAGLPAGEPEAVVQGWGHRSAAWPRPPTVAELDAVSGRHPVVLISGDGHNGWLNTPALRALGLPPRDSVLAETPWFAVLARLGELPGAADREQAACRRAADRASAAGLVGIVDMELDANHRTWPARVDAGIDGLRVRGATYPDRLDELVAAGLGGGDAYASGAGLLRVGPLKVISDGSLNTRTAYCHEPYADAAGLPHPHGTVNHPLPELTDLCARARAAGLTVAIHAIGDAAVTSALEAVERTGATGSLEHVQLVRRSDLTRMARLALVASVQPAHLLDDRDLTERCWPDRAHRCFAFRAMRSAGITLALGSDAPVSPLDPWLAMAAAVHRSADDRPPWHPEQAITAAEALAASTDGQSTLGVGGRGDLVLVDRDPLALPDPRDTAAVAARLRTTPVAATFVAGRPTYLAL